MENIAKQPIQATHSSRITIGEMDNECQHCHALLFPGDNSSLYCMNGKVQLPAEPPLPENLLTLYKTGDENSRFRKNIRSYINHFSFASMQYNLLPPPGRGGFVFRICRQIGHQVGPLHQGQNENWPYGQLYTYDANVAVQQHIQNNEGFQANINPRLLGIIKPVLRQHNPFVAAYRHMYEVEIEQNCLAEANGEETPIVRMYLLDGRRDPRRYN